MTPTARAAQAAAPFVAVPAAALGLALGFTVGWVAGVVAFGVLAGVLAAWARWAGEWLISSRLGGRPADPRAEARLCNLVEGLSTGAGVRYPRLLVVDSAGLNAMAFGAGRGRAVLAVTSGLLSELDPIELEAVIAEELYLIRYRQILPATVVAATFGLGRRLAIGTDSDALADQGAVSLTRYPPALAAALEKVETKGAEVPGQPRWAAHLWLAEPAAGAAPAWGRLPLAERIEALREL